MSKYYCKCCNYDAKVKGELYKAFENIETSKDRANTITKQNENASFKFYLFIE